MTARIAPLLHLLILGGLTACGESTLPAEPAVPADATTSSIYAAAVTVDSRLEGDYARDAGRKPEQVLEFLGIARGDRVLDMFSGGGYYSEILSHVVGDDGTVHAHSNEAYLNFVGDEFEQRYANDRLQNVTILMAENNELDLEAGQYDAITLMLAYHDVYYADPGNGWPKIDVPRLLAELRKGLRDDGIIGVVDHRAEAGAPREVGGTVHRIDPSVVVADFEAAGFTLAGKSDLLRSTHDDYSKNVFDVEVRGKTDRFILKFRKTD